MSNESRKAFEIWFATQYATANFSRHEHNENDYEETYESVAWFAWQSRDAQIAELRAEAERLKEAEDESCFVINKLSQLLAATAIALKGEPEALRSHSYHDIPELAATLKSVNDRLLAWQASMRSDIDYLAQALIDSESVITSGAKVIEELLDENGADVGIERRVEDFKASLLNLGHWRTRDAFVNSAAARLNELLAWQASVMADVGRTAEPPYPGLESHPVQIEYERDYYRQSALNLAAKLKEAQDNGIPAGALVVAECDVVPHVHPQYGSGMFFTESALLGRCSPQPVKTEATQPNVRYIVSYHEANTICLMAGIDSGSVGMRAGWYLVSFDDRGRGAFYGDAHDTPEAALNSKPLKCAACNTSDPCRNEYGIFSRKGQPAPIPCGTTATTESVLKEVISDLRELNKRPLEPIYMVPGDTSSPIVGHRSAERWKASELKRWTKVSAMSCPHCNGIAPRGKLLHSPGCQNES